MKQDCDLYTAELKLPRKGGRKKIYASTADRVAAHRARTGKATLTALVDSALLKRLDEFMLARDETKSQVVKRALAQFFRKR